MQRRHHAEEESRSDRDDCRERQQSPVELNGRAILADTREAGGVDGEKRANAEQTEREPERATDQRQQHALRYQLSNDATSCRAHRGADCHLAFADGRSNQQQVRDVRARDQENAAYGGKKHDEQRT